MATMNPETDRPLTGLPTRSTADEAPPRRTHTAIIALFSVVVLALAGTLAVIATTTPA